MKKQSQPPQSQADRAIWAVVCLALVLRLVYALAIAPAGYHGPDERLYDRIATRLITEGKYEAEDHFDKAPERPVAFERSKASRPVLFPFFLAGVRAVFGGGFAMPRVFQCLLGALTCGLVYSLGKEAFGRRAAIMAGAGAALFPQLIYYCGTLTTETLHIFMLTSAVYLLFAARRRDAGLPWWAAGGLCLGLAVLARSALLPFVPAAVLWVLISMKEKRTAAVRCAVIAAAATIAMAPWVIRNYREFGAFVPATTEGGYTFWLTNNPAATGGGECYLPADTRAFAGLGELAADRLFYRMGFEWIGANPGQFLKLCGAKFVRLWRPWPHADEVGTRAALIGGVSFVPVALLAVWGLAITWRRRRELLLFYLLIGCITAVSCLYMAVTRYRAPLMPVLLVPAGHAAAELLARAMPARKTAANDRAAKPS